VGGGGPPVGGGGPPEGGGGPPEGMGAPKGEGGEKGVPGNAAACGYPGCATPGKTG
jgi:hypothetical protein